MSANGQIERRIERAARLRWVPLTQMRVNPQAQRDLNRARVAQLAASFSTEQMGAPVVSHRGGWFYLIDGQHRIEAVKLWFGSWENQQVQCWCYEGLTEEQEAELFLTLNDTLPVRAFAKFKVAVQAGRDAEADVDRIVCALGLRIAAGRSGGGISAVATLRRVYDRAGRAVAGIADHPRRLRGRRAGGPGHRRDRPGVPALRRGPQRAARHPAAVVGAWRGVRTDQPGRAAAPVHRQRRRPVRSRGCGRGHQPRLLRPEAPQLVEERPVNYANAERLAHLSQHMLAEG
jgi:hypothetical protein